LNCRHHPASSAIGTCTRCGEPFCAECVLEIDGLYYCERCEKDAVVEGARANRRSARKRQGTRRVVVAMLAVGATLAVLAAGAAIAFALR
jgi:hypothetical protein